MRSRLNITFEPALQLLDMNVEPVSGFTFTEDITETDLLDILFYEWRLTTARLRFHAEYSHTGIPSHSWMTPKVFVMEVRNFLAGGTYRTDNAEWFFRDLDGNLKVLMTMTMINITMIVRFKLPSLPCLPCPLRFK